MAEQTAKGLDKEITALTRANEKLQAENKSLKTELHHQQAFGRGWRVPIIGLFVALATACLVVGNVLLWTSNTVLNTEKYSHTVNAIAEDSAVQQAIAHYTTSKLFDSVDVTSVISN
jgi:hypothetical protein